MAQSQDNMFSRFFRRRSGGAGVASASLVCQLALGAVLLAATANPLLTTACSNNSNSTPNNSDHADDRCVSGARFFFGINVASLVVSLAALLISLLVAGNRNARRSPNPDRVVGLLVQLAALLQALFCALVFRGRAAFELILFTAPILNLIGALDPFQHGGHPKSWFPSASLVAIIVTSLSFAATVVLRVLIGFGHLSATLSVSDLSASVGPGFWLAIDLLLFASACVSLVSFGIIGFQWKHREQAVKATLTQFIESCQHVSSDDLKLGKMAQDVLSKLQALDAESYSIGASAAPAYHVQYDTAGSGLNTHSNIFSGSTLEIRWAECEVIALTIVFPNLCSTLQECGLPDSGKEIQSVWNDIFQTIQAQGGRIDRVGGDAMVATFFDRTAIVAAANTTGPNEPVESILAACRSALAVQQLLFSKPKTSALYNFTQPTMSLLSQPCVVALASPMAALSLDTVVYGSIFDDGMVLARLNGILGTCIAFTETIAPTIGEHFSYRQVDVIKGFGQGGALDSSTTVYELLGPLGSGGIGSNGGGGSGGGGAFSSSASPSALSAWIRPYTMGFNAFCEGRLSDAACAFEEFVVTLKKREIRDACAERLLRVCKAYSAGTFDAPYYRALSSQPWKFLLGESTGGVSGVAAASQAPNGGGKGYRSRAGSTATTLTTGWSFTFASEVLRRSDTAKIFRGIPNLAAMGTNNSSSSTSLRGTTSPSTVASLTPITVGMQQPHQSPPPPPPPPPTAGSFSNKVPNNTGSMRSRRVVNTLIASKSMGLSVVDPSASAQRLDLMDSSDASSSSLVQDGADLSCSSPATRPPPKGTDIEAPSSPRLPIPIAAPPPLLSPPGSPTRQALLQVFSSSIHDMDKDSEAANSPSYPPPFPQINVVPSTAIAPTCTTEDGPVGQKPLPPPPLPPPPQPASSQFLGGAQRRLSQSAAGNQKELVLGSTKTPRSGLIFQSTNPNSSLSDSFLVNPLLNDLENPAMPNPPVAILGGTADKVVRVVAPVPPLPPPPPLATELPTITTTIVGDDDEADSGPPGVTAMGGRANSGVSVTTDGDSTDDGSLSTYRKGSTSSADALNSSMGHTSMPAIAVPVPNNTPVVIQLSSATVEGSAQSPRAVVLPRLDTLSVMAYKTSRKNASARPNATLASPSSPATAATAASMRLEVPRMAIRAPSISSMRMNRDSNLGSEFLQTLDEMVLGGGAGLSTRGSPPGGVYSSRSAYSVLSSGRSTASQPLTSRERAAKGVVKVCLTGGPCSGKSTSMSTITTKLGSQGIAVYTVPEAATLLINGGMVFENMNAAKAIAFQTVLMKTQIHLEDSFCTVAEAVGAPRNLIVCDRGIMDGKAYCSEEDWEAIMGNVGQDVVQLRDERYDIVLHLVTAADGAESFYTLANNVARTETPEQAKSIDQRLKTCWLGHPRVEIVDNSTGFEEKIDKVIAVISEMMGLTTAPSGGRVRRFLVQSADTIEFAVATEESQMQTLFLRGSQRGQEIRICRRGLNTKWMYFSQKVHTPPNSTTAVLTERRITNRQYAELLIHTDTALANITQTIHSFVWNNRSFELQQFHSPASWENKAFLCVRMASGQDATELSDEDFPAFIKREMDVTDLEGYSLYEIASTCSVFDDKPSPKRRIVQIQ